MKPHRWAGLTCSRCGVERKRPGQLHRSGLRGKAWAYRRPGGKCWSMARPECTGVGDAE